MIRLANKFDKAEVIEMMTEFRLASGINHYKELDNSEHWSRLYDALINGLGVIYLEQGKGLIMGIITPTVWCDKTRVMQELAWYVRPQYRQTTIGYRLFKQYVQHGEMLKFQGRIKFMTLGKLANSPPLDYSKYGFTKLDETWSK